MDRGKQENTSPFAAMSYQEQQDRWMEWRSRQLDYRPVDEPRETGQLPPPEKELPPLTLPNFRAAAPTRHGELDKVLERHAMAKKRIGQYQSTAPFGSGR